MTGQPALAAPTAAPWKRLLLLAAAVFALHLLLLGGVDLRLETTSPSALPRPLITRTVSAPAPPKSTARPPARRVARPSAPPPTPAPTPAIEPAPVAEPAPTAAPALPESTTSAPEAPASAPALAEAEPAAPTPPAAPPPLVPGSLRLKYDIVGQVKQLNYNASGDLIWRHDGESYDAQLQVRLFLLGSRTQTSRGQITPQGLAPKRFSDKVRSEVAAHFEYDKGKVVFSANTPEAPLQAGAQDQLSIFIQIAGLLASDPARYPRGTAFEMQAVGARDSDTWRFVVDGEERLNLPGGELDTLKLTRTPNRPHDLNVEIWLAPSVGYLPVRIRLTQDNGDYVDQQWRGSDTP